MLTIIAISLFCIIYSSFLSSFIHIILFYGIPTSLKMGEAKMVNYRPILVKSYAALTLGLTTFLVPIFLIYIFLNRFLDQATIGYAIGIIAYYIFIGKDKAYIKKVFISNYITDFHKYFYPEKENEINDFFKKFSNN